MGEGLSQESVSIYSVDRFGRFDVELTFSYRAVTFSNIRFGPVGTTVDVD